MINASSSKKVGASLADSLSDMLQRSTRGSLILLLGKIVSTLVAALGMILVARFLGATSYGLLTVAMIPVSIAALFRDLGVTSALIRYVAQYHSEGRTAEAKAMMRAGLILNAAVGASLSLVTFSLSGILAVQVFHQPGLARLIKIASAAILAESVLSTSRSIFVGFERMELHSLTMVIESALKSVSAPLLVFLGLGAFGAILGETAAVAVTALIGIAIVGTVLYRGGVHRGAAIGLLRACRILLDYGYPLFLSVLLSGALSRFYDFLMAVYVDASMIGNYKAALNFSVLITFLTMPIATVLFPLFSRLDMGEDRMLRIVFQNSVKYAALVTVPATMALMVLSGQLVRVIYGSSYQSAPLLLKLYIINFLFVGLGGLVVGSFLMGQGRTKINFLMQLINLCIGVPLGFVLIPRYGIIGLLLTMLIASKPNLFYALWWIRRNFGFTLNWVASAKIYLSAGLASSATFILLFFLKSGDWIELLLGGGLFLLIYSLLVPLTGALDDGDIRNLRDIMGGLGPLTSLFNLFMSFAARLTRRTGSEGL